MRPSIAPGRRGRSSATALALALLAGCAPKPYLHWQGGDAFGVFDTDARAPTRIDCPGTTQERFACFAAKVHDRVHDVSGALALIDADGELLQTSVTEPGAAPITADTPLPLLSVTKMFTAATAVRLAQDGELDLQRPIASYLPELAGSELGRVTLHQLLTHTAGLVDDPHRKLCEGGAALADAVARAHLGAQPGTVYLYSNLGYALVGLVIERVTATPFADVVRGRVLQPMGLASATFDFARVPVRGHPSGAGDGSRCPLVAPAGGLNASARDVARWARAMSEPATHPLGEPLVTALTTPYAETGAPPAETYGYGVSILRRGDVRVYAHSGGVEDFSAFVAWMPERRVGAAAVMNATNAQGVTPALVVLRAFSVLLDLPDDWRPTVEGAPRPLEAYAGTYVDRRSWLGRLRVRVDGDHLAFDYPDGAPSLLPPTFVFQFAPGETHAPYVVTAVGVGERVADAERRR